MNNRARVPPGGAIGGGMWNFHLQILYDIVICGSSCLSKTLDSIAPKPSLSMQFRNHIGAILARGGIDSLNVMDSTYMNNRARVDGGMCMYRSQ